MEGCLLLAFSALSPLIVLRTPTRCISKTWGSKSHILFQSMSKSKRIFHAEREEGSVKHGISQARGSQTEHLWRLLPGPVWGSGRTWGTSPSVPSPSWIAPNQALHAPHSTMSRMTSTTNSHSQASFNLTCQQPFKSKLTKVLQFTQMTCTWEMAYSEQILFL